MAKLSLLSVVAVVSVLSGSAVTHAFQLPRHGLVALSGRDAARQSSSTYASTSLSMAPRFDKDTQKWFVTNPEVWWCWFSVQLSLLTLECSFTSSPSQTWCHFLSFFPNIWKCRLPYECILLVLWLNHDQMQTVSRGYIRRKVHLRGTIWSAASTVLDLYHSSSALSMPIHTSRRFWSIWHRRGVIAL